MSGNKWKWYILSIGKFCPKGNCNQIILNFHQIKKFSNETFAIRFQNLNMSVYFRWWTRKYKCNVRRITRHRTNTWNNSYKRSITFKSNIKMWVTTIFFIYKIVWKITSNFQYLYSTYNIFLINRCRNMIFENYIYSCTCKKKTNLITS